MTRRLDPPSNCGESHPFLSGVAPFVRTWGWRAALCSSLMFLGAAVFYYTQFLVEPSSFHIYGAYYGLRDRAELFAEYAAGSLLVGGWMRGFGARLLEVSAMVLALLVLNFAFAWTSHISQYVLALLPTWLPQALFIDYLSYVQFPFVRAALDYYYLGWLGALFLLSMVLLKSGLVGRLVHSLEIVMLVLIPLPFEVFLFDRREFNIPVTVAQVGTPLQWFTNADLLAVLVTGLTVLAIADDLFLKGAVGKLARSRSRTNQT